MLLFSILACAFAAAIFALLALLAARRRDGGVAEQIARTVRAEADRSRSDSVEQFRGTRQEMTSNLQGFQTATLQAFTELGRRLGDQTGEFGGRLDTALRSQHEQFESFAHRLSENLAEIDRLLHRGLADMGGAVQAHQQALDERFARQIAASEQAARALRDELSGSMRRLSDALAQSLTQLGGHQQQRLDEVARQLAVLSDSQSRAQDALRTSVEGRLDAIRTESLSRLDEMRRTVDERLQSTLERRLNESFRAVSEQLERVHQGLGEMQNLAAGVGDLRRVFANVRVRGTWGEIQLGSLLEQFLAPGQFDAQVQVRDGSTERVDYVIRLPGRDGENEVLLPIDAKFPQDSYERLVRAAEEADGAAVASHAATLEATVKSCAQSIQDKYINPPRTTDFAILFLPVESLYAEVLRRPGLFEQIQRQFHVTIAGPTTLTALLNALQMGFRSLAIEERSSEVWQLLGAIRTEFGRYGDVVDRLRMQLNSAANTVESLGRRARVMNRRLREVEQLPEDAAQGLLRLDAGAADDADDRVEQAEAAANTTK